MRSIVLLKAKQLVCWLLGEKLYSDTLVVHSDLRLFSHVLASHRISHASRTIFIFLYRVNHLVASLHVYLTGLNNFLQNLGVFASQHFQFTCINQSFSAKFSSSTLKWLTLFSELAMLLLKLLRFFWIIAVNIFLDRISHITLLDLLNLLPVEVHILEPLKLSKELTFLYDNCLLWWVGPNKRLSILTRHDGAWNNF